MSAFRASRHPLHRSVRVVGWTALAFAGLTVTAGLAHADDGSPAVSEVVMGTPAIPAEVPAAAAEQAPAPADSMNTAADAAEQPAAEPDVPAEGVTGEDARGAGELDEADQGGEADQDDEADGAGETDAAEEADAAGETAGAEETDAAGESDAAGDPLEDTEGTADTEGTESTEPLESPESPDGTDFDPVTGEATAPGTLLPGATDLLPEQAGLETPAAVEVPTVLDTPAARETSAALTATPAPQRAPASIAPAAVKVGFKDVPRGMMYAEEILWMQSKGYTTGWPDGTYRPLEDVNRDAFVAMLYRVHAPKNYVAPKRSRFVDVSTSNMFYRQISWAAQSGVTTGWADGTFRPLAPIDRDAALAMLYRTYGGGASAPARSPFTDITPRTQHYEAMSWGFANGVTTGWNDGTFRPGEQIHRDAIAVMIHRLEVLGTDSQRGLTSGPTGTHWAATGGKSKIGNPTGYQYRYGAGLRQDFQRGSVLYSPSKKTTVLLNSTTRKVYDAGGGQAAFGMPITPQRTVAGSVGLQFDRGGIFTTDGFTFSVTGTMYNYYRSLGGMTSYLGAPIGNQRVGSSGITYQSFKGGQLTSYMFSDTPPRTTPAGTKMPAYRTLQLGSRDFSGNNQVYAVQVKVGVEADGVFGSATRAAVQAYQRAHGLSATGIVDTRTWSRIISTPNQIFDGSNGRLSAREQTIVAPNWTLPKSAAAPFLAMQRAFTAETGRTFQLNDAYRPIDRQILMLVLYGRPRAAYPGTSPHGHADRGAVDIQVTRGDATHTWLLRNASRFGFGQTAWQAKNEAWHWERR